MTTAGLLEAGRVAEEAQSHRASDTYEREREGVPLSIGAKPGRAWVNRIPRRG